ncbi:Rrf2 family transcriptional regulator [Cytophagaceae bacterium ABcell3]|nr:Rrf2 family transcriptional regulator [Cytophagaceae bacterium ABcell3]
MLSITCKVAIKAVIFIGFRYMSERKSGIKEIAGFINESEHTVGKTLQKLVKDDVVKSAKGPGGGFYITPEQKEQPISKIIEAVDGKEVFNSCGLGLSRCSDEHPCPIHKFYKPIRDMYRSVCHEKKIGDLDESVFKGVAYLSD